MTKRPLRIIIFIVFSFVVFKIIYLEKNNQTRKVDGFVENGMKMSFNLSEPCNLATILYSYAMGLGNMMFVYASLYGISKNNKKNFFMPTYFNFPLTKFFNLSVPELDVNYDNFDKITESVCCRYEENVESLPCDKNVTIYGYRISYKYFNNYFNDIKNEFTFVDEYKRLCDSEMRRISVSNNCLKSIKRCIFVGLHIRRGNILNEEQVKYGYLSTNSNYLEKSMNFMENLLTDFTIYFLIFGDDYRWNVENVGKIKKKRNLIFFNDFSPVVDLCILSRCNHTIITTGTFGWWSAFFSGGTVIYMKDQCRPGSNLCSQFHMDDYVLPHWIPL